MTWLKIPFILCALSTFTIIHSAPIADGGSHEVPFSNSRDLQIPEGPTIPNLIYLTRQQVFETINGAPAPLSVVKTLAQLIVVSKRQNSRDLTTTCSGTVVARQWLLTAATCFLTPGGTTVSVKDSYAFVAEANATLRIENTTIRPYKFQKYLVHKKYNTRNFAEGTDIALIRLDRPIDDDNFSKVTLSSSDSTDPTPVVFVKAAGYGLIPRPDNALGLPAVVAKEVNLTMEEFKVCKAGSPAFGSIVNEEKLVCTVPIQIGDGFTDTCLGDGGGPLYVRSSDEPMLQFGINSFSSTSRCAQPDTVGWYTRVSCFYKDITQALGNNFESWNVISA